MEPETVTKTFKEVHDELENESLFLQKNHDVSGFKAKADFLESVGFKNSIATKLYAAVADNHGVVNDYAIKYNGRYKFILAPQLERVCEKYNLFVRDTEFFLGDIPEKNIKDIMGFSVYVEDITDDMNRLDRWMYLNRSVINHGMGGIADRKPKIKIEDLRSCGLGGLIQIAAIKGLFDERAFEKSQARIVNKTELSAKHQVDLDPIVLCRTIHGYIIITAWGDEANDELVVNQNSN